MPAPNPADQAGTDGWKSSSYDPLHQEGSGFLELSWFVIEAEWLECPASGRRHDEVLRFTRQAVGVVVVDLEGDVTEAALPKPR